VSVEKRLEMRSERVERTEREYREACDALSELHKRRRELKDRLRSLSLPEAWREERDVKAELEAVGRALNVARGRRDETRSRWSHAKEQLRKVRARLSRERESE